MLADTPLSPCLATTDIGRAKTFYKDTLGLALREDMGMAAAFKTPGSDLFIYEREKPPTTDATVVTWWVKDIRSAVRDLRAKGVEFEVYEGFGQDGDGISAMGENGPWAAWFKDPDGNVLGLTQPTK